MTPTTELALTWQQEELNNILERGTQNKYLFINKKSILGRGNDPLLLSTSPSLDELLNLMETQTMRVESNLGKPRTQGLLWEMRSESLRWSDWLGMSEICSKTLPGNSWSLSRVCKLLLPHRGPYLQESTYRVCSQAGLGLNLGPVLLWPCDLGKANLFKSISTACLSGWLKKMYERASIVLDL